MLSGLPPFTLFHVYLSLIGILSGLVMGFGWAAKRQFQNWTTLFFGTTIASVMTGFLFPFHHLLPSHILGILSTIALAISLYARFGKSLEGGWRSAYVIGAMLALYFNTFIFIVQLFEKQPHVRALAPTKTESPFKMAQGAALVLFIALTTAAVRRFHEPQR